MEQSSSRYAVTRMKIILVGDASVGKTCLANRFVKNLFYEQHTLTISDIETKTVTINRQPVMFQIWDTAGQERYRSLLPMYMKGIDGAVLVYDVTDKKSFTSIDTWLTEIRKHGPDDAVISLVGNKVDLARNEENKRTVFEQQSSEFARERGITFTEASAKTGENVDVIFMDIGRSILERNKPRMSTNYQDVCKGSLPPEKKSSCC